jgi:hypothetical protein
MNERLATYEVTDPISPQLSSSHYRVRKYRWEADILGNSTEPCCRRVADSASRETRVVKGTRRKISPFYTIGLLINRLMQNGLIGL